MGESLSISVTTLDGPAQRVATWQESEIRPLFFTGVHQPSDAHRLYRTMISINRLMNRRSDFLVNDWILDSGAFTRISQGREHLSALDYAARAIRWSRCGNLLAVVSQDWMCEPFVLEVTGLSRVEHQVRTAARFQELRELLNGQVYLMPVLQGYAPTDYQEHIEMYGPDLEDGAWVGVGSVCKRNTHPNQVAGILEAIVEVRPDLRLHGFGIKTTALAAHRVSRRLYSCDSMAWSYAARRDGQNANSIEEAIRFTNQIASRPIQLAF